MGTIITIKSRFQSYEGAFIVNNLLAQNLGFTPSLPSPPITSVIPSGFSCLINWKKSKTANHCLAGIFVDGNYMRWAGMIFSKLTKKIDGCLIFIRDLMSKCKDWFSSHLHLAVPTKTLIPKLKLNNSQSSLGLLCRDIFSLVVHLEVSLSVCNVDLIVAIPLSSLGPHPRGRLFLF